ncbi:hypothetical protein QVD17_22871 [Tagetes erecta]|uniref:Uncharacterized protein n=1 Tax=Tagetes erecta TaxID=13708 RepID=A0AAD8KDE1_TARER|nr:hypothetical protein QVD17_22871 [Tagetes erecta]
MTLQTPSLIAPSSPVIVHRSPWHSPVPYLFGGLAAMLSLIAFALLILACSYSKHSGDRDNDGDGETDLEAGTGDSKPDNQKNESPVVFEEKFLVIMAGEAKPTFLATPVSSRATSFGSCSCRSNSSEKSSTSEEEEDEKEKQGSNDQVQVRVIGNEETADQGR